MTCKPFSNKTIWLVILAALLSVHASAQILTADQVQKVAPTSFFFAGQTASTQLRNTVGLKTSAGKLMLAGLVDTSGYSTDVAEKYQGFVIVEGKFTFGESTLDPGQYGFGFKDGKFTVMNVAGANMFSVDSRSDEQLQRPVPLKLVKDGMAYRFYAGRKYVVVKAD